MSKNIIYKGFLYAIASALPVFVVFFSDYYEIWKSDQAYVVSIPWFIWTYLILNAIYQVVLVLRAFADGTIEREKQETKESKENEKH